MCICFLILRYMCIYVPHTTVYPHTMHTCICVLILPHMCIYVSSYYCLCVYICPHTTVHVSFQTCSTDERVAIDTLVVKGGQRKKEIAVYIFSIASCASCIYVSSYHCLSNLQHRRARRNQVPPSKSSSKLLVICPLVNYW